MTSPSWVWATALLASCSRAWVTRDRSRRISPTASPSMRHRRSASPPSFSTTSSVRSVMSTGSGRTKSGRSDVARVMRSSTSRDIRSSSSITRSRVARTSSGSSASTRSRCPRTIVTGVRSSCPTSLSRSRWLANALSSRSSMSLNRCPRSEISSLPCTSIRCDRSRSSMLAAAPRSWASGDSSRPSRSQPTAAATTTTAP